MRPIACGKLDTGDPRDVSTRALFLDRDGVINVDKHYVHSREDFEWMPGIFDLVRTARDAGALTIVVTNQSGVARGYYSEETFRTLTDWMTREFEAAGTPIARVYHCPHLKGPDGKDHPMRKPNPGMLLQAESELGIDMAASAMLGDKWADMDAGIAAGVGANAIVGPRIGEHAGDARYKDVARLKDLAAARAWAATVLRA